MADHILEVPDHLKREPTLQYLTEKQLAERLGCSTYRLYELRLNGGGPPFIRLGRSVRYATPGVLAWEADLPVKSTSVE